MFTSSSPSSSAVSGQSAPGQAEPTTGGAHPKHLVYLVTGHGFPLIKMGESNSDYYQLRKRYAIHYGKAIKLWTWAVESKSTGRELEKIFKNRFLEEYDSYELFKTGRWDDMAEFLTQTTRSRPIVHYKEGDRWFPAYSSGAAASIQQRYRTTAAGKHVNRRATYLRLIKTGRIARPNPAKLKQHNIGLVNGEWKLL